MRMDHSDDLKWNDWVERDTSGELIGESLPPESVSKVRTDK